MRIKLNPIEDVVIPLLVRDAGREIRLLSSARSYQMQAIVGRGKKEAGGRKVPQLYTKSAVGN